MGYKVDQAPVEWDDKGESLVGISGYISTFKDLFKTRWNVIKGVYKLNEKTKEIKNK